MKKRINAARAGWPDLGRPKSGRPDVGHFTR
jgi:hypothetical protein